WRYVAKYERWRGDQERERKAPSPTPAAIANSSAASVQTGFRFGQMPASSALPHCWVMLLSSHSQVRSLRGRQASLRRVRLVVVGTSDQAVQRLRGDLLAAADSEVEVQQDRSKREDLGEKDLRLPSSAEGKLQ